MSIRSDEAEAPAPTGESVVFGSESDLKAAFQRLAMREIPGLYSLARRLVQDGAEDLVQETLLRGYRSFRTLKSEAAGGRWLKTTMVNIFRDQIRKQGRSLEELSVETIEDFSLYQTLIAEDPFPYSDALHLDFLHSFAKEDIGEVLLRLPTIYRACLVLRYMEGYSTKEIARMLDLPLGTVLARLHRGRKLFEKQMWIYAEETDLLLRRTTP